ncbi:hypothetical protein [Paenibacillus sp. FSL P4-0288]|uniref:hypothetical protein n=1 Tax=Paenibacillus sp. FSL P4-0288 TaxID=2921633 RepID=UPI0030F836E2
MKKMITGIINDRKKESGFKHILTDFPLYVGDSQIGSQLSLPGHLTQEELLTVLSSEYEKLTGIKTGTEYTVHMLGLQNIIEFERLNPFQQQSFLRFKKIENPLSKAKRIMATGRPTKEIALIVASDRAAFEKVNDEMFRFQMKTECVFIGKESLV